MEQARRDRFLYVLETLVGTKVEARELTGTVHSGVFHTSTPFADVPHRVVLKGALEREGYGLGATLVLDMAKLASLKCAGVAMKAITREGGFRTDGDISGNRRSTERQLEMVDESWLTPPVVKGKPAPKGKKGGAWDQFEANERLFNVTSSFDENMYTTALDTTKLSSQQKAEAERIADEIMNATSVNSHIAEERGHKVADDGMDEEDRYSGVLRVAKPVVAAAPPPGLNRAPSPKLPPSTTTGSPKVEAPPSPAAAEAPAPAKTALNPAAKEFKLNVAAVEWKPSFGAPVLPPPVVEMHPQQQMHPQQMHPEQQHHHQQQQQMAFNPQQPQQMMYHHPGMGAPVGYPQQMMPPVYVPGQEWHGEQYGEAQYVVPAPQYAVPGGYMQHRGGFQAGFGAAIGGQMGQPIMMGNQQMQRQMHPAGVVYGHPPQQVPYYPQQQQQQQQHQQQQHQQQHHRNPGARGGRGGGGNPNSKKVADGERRRAPGTPKNNNNNNRNNPPAAAAAAPANEAPTPPPPPAEQPSSS